MCGHYFWFNGMWAFPVIMLTVMLVMIYLIFRQGMCGSSRFFHSREESGTALDILKKRYAKGEVSKEEFEQMKKDLLD